MTNRPTSAPGAGQFSSPQLILTNSAGADQGVKNDGEPSHVAEIPSTGAMTRRNLMHALTAGVVVTTAFRAKPAVATAREAKRAPGDEHLWSLYDNFERAYNRMKSLETPEASAGSGRDATPEQKAAHRRWERACSGAFRAARRVMSEPALTGNGLLMKLHVAGFELDTAKGTFTMPYRGVETPAWRAGRFSDAGAEFVASIAEDLRRAKLALS
ncbi:hypothetical protein [Bradyrhizobium tunisiense]|uniref:hypothetical protein n=1 Tax=Bradyrhizobium tunisiense TaxID=3278709 RepID=UPI0035DBBDB7